MRMVLKLLALTGVLITIKSINLLSLPLYLDEGIYIFWSKLMRESAGFAYVSLQDGKTPLFMWILSRIYPWFGQYLLAGRLISVVSAGVIFFSWAIIINRTWHPKAYRWLWLLMIVSPYTYLVERMAFVDSLLVAFSSLSLMMSVVARDSIVSNIKRWKFLFPSLISGLFIALAFMTKSSARIFLVGQVAVSFMWIIEQIFSKQLKKAFLILVSLLVIFGTYSERTGYMRIGAYRFWAMIQTKEAQMIFPISQIFSSPDISLYRVHSALVADYASAYLGGILVFVILGLWHIVRNQPRLIWLIAYTCLIIFIIFLSGRVTASRYFYMAVPSLLAIAVIGISRLLNFRPVLGRLLVILILLLSFHRSLLMVLSPLKASYADDDQGHFVGGDVSALGLTDSIQHLKNNSFSSVVGITGIWGVAEGSLVTFQDANINAVKLDNLSKDQIDRVIKEPQKDKYLYLTGKDTNLDSLAKLVNFNIEKKYTRPYSNYSVYLLKILNF